MDNDSYVENSEALTGTPMIATDLPEDLTLDSLPTKEAGAEEEDDEPSFKDENADWLMNDCKSASLTPEAKTETLELV